MKNLITGKNITKMEKKKERSLISVLKLSVLLLAVMIFSSCAKLSLPIKMDDIQTVERGIHYAKFRSLIKRKPTLSFSIQHKSLCYAVEIYAMLTGTLTMLTGPAFWERFSEDYVFVFHDDHLIYWGFLNEYHKSDDELVRQLAPLISEQCEK